MVVQRDPELSGKVLEEICSVTCMACLSRLLQCERSLRKPDLNAKSPLLIQVSLRYVRFNVNAPFVLSVVPTPTMQQGATQQQRW